MVVVVINDSDSGCGVNGIVLAGMMLVECMGVHGKETWGMTVTVYFSLHNNPQLLCIL